MTCAGLLAVADSSADAPAERLGSLHNRANGETPIPDRAPENPDVFPYPGTGLAAGLAIAVLDPMPPEIAGQPIDSVSG